LWEKDLQFPDSGHDWSSVLAVPTGVVTDAGWIVFLRRQVFLCVPDEVHSLWHWEVTDTHERSSMWHIEDSA
jgi:hypothetical protein